MSVIEEALVSILAADGTVSGLVGTRIYPLVVPQNPTLPAVVYQRISGVREHTHDRTGDLARPRFQFTSIATTYSAAKALANAVREALDNYSATKLSVVIDAIFVENEIDVFNLSEDQGDNTYGVLVDATVWHHE